MASTFYLRAVCEIAVVIFSIYRTLLFFLAHRNRWTLAGLLMGSLFFLTEIPYALLQSPAAARIAPYGLALLFVLVIFEPELRWPFRQLAVPRVDRRFFAKNGPLDEIVRTCHILSTSKTGALMAVVRKDNLSPFIEKSVVIDARIRHELLTTIFTPPTYLHDGGVILSSDRIVSCSAIFPLTESPDLHKSLGTRHRAAVGLSEATDALVIVVSEENGAISLADRGKLYYDVRPHDLRPTIEKMMHFKNVK